MSPSRRLWPLLPLAAAASVIAAVAPASASATQFTRVLNLAVKLP
jgi:hypothetical protein